MDAFTHGLASYSLTRAFFPRATRLTTSCVILAGMAADLDGLSRYASASIYLNWHRTYLHSISGMLGIAIVFSSIAAFLEHGKAQRVSSLVILLAAVSAGTLHLTMDITQNDTVQLLWPLRATRYSSDWVAHFDLWIMLALLAGVLLPQLLGLVTEEIGAKSKAPRGRIGAILALTSVALYVGGRAILHANAVGTMDSRTYRGETPRRMAAFAEPDSPLRWRGIVETERAIHQFPFDSSSPASFNPDAGVVSFKPEPSPALDAAKQAESVKRFLAVARFPRASVEKTATGFRVQIRDMTPPSEDGQRRSRIIAVVETDATARVLSDELVYAGKL